MMPGTRRQRRFWCVVAALAAVAAPGVAAACGGFFVPDSEVDTAVVDSNDQRVLYAIDEGRIRQFVQVEYSGEASELAWIYPVAGNPTVAEGPDDLFQRADSISRPTFTVFTPGYDGGDGGGVSFGCAGDMGATNDRGDSTIDEQVVDVWSSGQVGMFDYVVVSSESVDPLLGWLEENGFAVPDEADPIISHYVGAGWFFVAMKISADQAESARTSTTTIVFDYEADEARFPLHMASLSSADGVSVLLYVIASTSYDTQGMGTTLVDMTRLAATSGSSTNYETLFLDAVGRGTQRSFVSESVVSAEPLLADALPGASGTFVLTRLRTQIDLQQMSGDVSLVPSAVNRTPFDPHYQVVWEEDYAAAGSRHEGLVAFAGVGLVCFFTFRRLRRRPRR
jgi:hypothetical protein